MFAWTDKPAAIFKLFFASRFLRPANIAKAFFYFYFAVLVFVFHFIRLDFEIFFVLTTSDLQDLL